MMTDDDDGGSTTCPVDGCSRTVLTHEVVTHVRVTDGMGHGSSGRLPGHVDLEDLGLTSD